MKNSRMCISGCGKILPPYSRPGPAPIYCDECRKAKRNAANRAWSKENPALVKAKHSRRRARLSVDHAQRLLVYARANAQRNGVPFSLTVNDIVIPDKCPVLGIPLLGKAEHKRQDNSATLDRLVPCLGYVKGNVRVISWRANRLKSDATRHEAVLLALYAVSDGMVDMVPWMEEARTYSQRLMSRAPLDPLTEWAEDMGWSPESPSVLNNRAPIPGSHLGDECINTEEAA